MERVEYRTLPGDKKVIVGDDGTVWKMRPLKDGWTRVKPDAAGLFQVVPRGATIETLLYRAGFREEAKARREKRLRGVNVRTLRRENEALAELVEALKAEKAHLMELVEALSGMLDGRQDEKERDVKD